MGDDDDVYLSWSYKQRLLFWCEDLATCNDNKREIAIVSLDVFRAGSLSFSPQPWLAQALHQ
jgi:hypothetical protein